MADATGTVQSALPPAARMRLAALEAAERGDTVPPATPPTPQVVPPVTPDSSTPPAPNTEQVTITRAEFNELQANAGKTQAALARAETERLRAEEAALRLTELEKTSKATPETPPAPALPVEDVTFTPDEEKDFGDSREFITKVVKQQLAPLVRQVNDLVAQLRTEVGKATQTAGAAVTTVTQSQERTFFEQVQSAVPNMEGIKAHKNWPDFLEETEELTGATYEVLLAHNVRNKNLKGVKNVYQRFTDKYLKDVTTPSAAAAGFAGGVPTGATETPGQAPAKLKQSDRKKASEDYRKGRITWDELQKVSKAFDEAEKAGNIDYNS